MIIARNTKEVKAQAFERTAKRMTVLHERLYKFEDEGTESKVSNLGTKYHALPPMDNSGR